MAGQTGVHVVVKSNRLPQISAALQPAVSKEVQKAGFDIESRAKQLVHVITSTLRRSIHTVISNGGMTATVGPSVGYGKYEEFGSRGRAPHPFMRPAAEFVYPRFVDAVKALLRGVK